MVSTVNGPKAIRTLPAASVARTWNVCWPSGSEGSAVWAPGVPESLQAAKVGVPGDPAAIPHSTPAPASVVKVQVGVESFVGPLMSKGPLVKVTLGGAVSTVKVRKAALAL